ncbi:MAG: YraN family protein [Candidatus Kapabacteria bacterium]|nr:YraN family protein [Candidatus Kapabacteria bacterium]
MMSEASTREVGERAEQAAVDYLVDSNYVIVERNWNYHNIGEIDIIAVKDETLVFVEVRYRTSTRYGLPELSISHGKWQKLRKTAKLYLAKHGAYRSKACRFDVIAIDMMSGEASLRHYVNCL